MLNRREYEVCLECIRSMDAIIENEYLLGRGTFMSISTKQHDRVSKFSTMNERPEQSE